MISIDAIIVDDEEDNISILKHFLKKYCPNVNVCGEAKSVTEAVRVLNKKKPDLVFLDIELGDGSGFDVLMQTLYNELKVIFVTAFDQYAIKAFKFNTLDYILKPIDISELIKAVNKAYDDLLKNKFTTLQQIQTVTKSIAKTPNLDFITITSTDKIEIVKLEDIVYLKSDGRYTIFQLTQKKLLATKNLGEFEKVISHSKFFRIHKSYIVNIKHLNSINKTGGYYCKMSNNDLLPIATRRKDSLINFLEFK